MKSVEKVTVNGQLYKLMHFLDNVIEAEVKETAVVLLRSPRSLRQAFKTGTAALSLLAVCVNSFLSK
jgi:hypothetical protein